LYFPKARLSQLSLIIACIACCAGPVAYSLDSVTVTHTGSIPSAGPSGTGMAGSNNETASVEKSLATYLEQHRDGAAWIVAVNSANESAPIQLTTGEPVMAVGGFDGSDTAISLKTSVQWQASLLCRQHWQRPSWWWIQQGRKKRNT
jgi:hypothetical protein